MMIIYWTTFLAGFFRISAQVEAYIPNPLSRGIRRANSRISLSERRGPNSSESNDVGRRTEEMYWEKYSGGSKEEMESPQISYPKEIDDDYEESSRIARYQKERARDYEEASYQDEYYEEPVDFSRYREEGEEDYEDFDDEYPYQRADPGNFWSNPSGGMDRPMAPKRRSGQSRSRGYATEVRRKPPSRRTPVRMKQGGVPNSAKIFYDQLFWSGFDADETEGVGDKTVFGGTKGKFNGLSYMDASERSPYQGSSPPPRRRYYDSYKGDNDIDTYDRESFGPSEDRPQSVKPPNDAPFPRSDPMRRRERRQRRPRRGQSDEYIDSFEPEGPGDWISKSVSSWFQEDEDDAYDDYDESSRRKRRRQESSEFNPFRIVDAFFGVDRAKMQYKADLYNAKMGLGKNRRSSYRNGSREPSGKKTPRRPGYAYKYEQENDDDDNSNSAFDVDTTLSAADNDTTTDGQNVARERTSRVTPQRKEKSWEERSLAVERVPPAEIPAWGPSGEMPFDARTKAIMDALEDIQLARQKLEKREKKEAFAMEEITILKVDAEMQRRKLRSARDPVFAQEQLRQIEFEMDDASRELRRARTSTDFAREQLETLEERHWALLRFYDPDKAEQEVEEALLELGEVEPAARLPDPSISSVENVEVNESSDSS